MIVDLKKRKIITYIYQRPDQPANDPTVVRRERVEYLPSLKGKFAIYIKK